MGSAYHTPVLLEEVIANLLTSLDGVYVDATIGGGGHAEAILMHLSASGRLFGFDRDEDAVRFAESRLRQFKSRTVVVRENFVNMRKILQEHGVTTIDGVLLDLGISSFQIEQPGKGFSFQHDESLDMRMDKRQNLTASTLLNTIEEKELGKILREYSEEYQARKIARLLVHEREKHSINTTGSLAVIVRKAARGRFVNKTLARVFQALRIAVNDELNNLQRVLHDVVEVLKSGGRVVVISYHSLEDRIVKNFFKTETKLRILTKKPIRPTANEVLINKRSRSAKMRVAERR
jgi:16S rRNA (cytosine1402-N4)-methyltransferase